MRIKQPENRPIILFKTDYGIAYIDKGAAGFKVGDTSLRPEVIPRSNHSDRTA